MIWAAQMFVIVGTVVLSGGMGPQDQNTALKERMAKLNEHNWRAASSLGNELAQLDPDEGFSLLKSAWGDLHRHDKQQMLKAWYFATPYPLHARLHPHIVSVLHLGMSDSDIEVQSWAIIYLKQMTFRNFAVDVTSYEEWFRENQDRNVRDVYTQAMQQFVNRARQASGNARAQCAKLLAANARTLRDVPDVRRTAVEAGLLNILEDWCATQDAQLTQETLKALQYLNVGEEYLRRVVVPVLASSPNLELRATAAGVLGKKEHPWALALLGEELKKCVDGGRVRDASAFARALAECEDPKVIPLMIGVIDADNSYDTVYGVGYFGLSTLTGVRYDEDHHGPWWRKWWSANKNRFSKEVQDLPIPDLPKTPHGQRFAEHLPDDASIILEPTLDDLLSRLTSRVASGKRNTFNTAIQIGEMGHARAIPTLIALIEADNTYWTVYGIGYFALGELTGVNYDEKHDGTWWRTWWSDNRERFGEPLAHVEVPRLNLSIPQRPDGEADDAADVPAEEYYVGGDENKHYFLIGSPHEKAKAAAKSKLLIVLPGGSGGAEFHPFVKRIYKHALPGEYLVAQLVSVEWSEGQFEQVVWPTRNLSVSDMKFTTEQFVGDVIADIRGKYAIDTKNVFTLGWSSGGPPCYSVALQSVGVTGTFVAMSVFKPKSLPPLDAASGHVFYVLHSPEDFIRIDMAQEAEKQLRSHGAKVKLATYDGGHGWHGDVYQMIRDGITWLENNQAE